MKHTLRQAKQEIKDIARLFGVKIKYRNLSHCSGFYSGHGSIIITPLYKKHEDPINELYSTFYHELQHFIAHASQKFAFYHNNNITRKSSKTAKLRVFRMALRVERWIDKKAKKISKLFTPRAKYYPGYSYKRHTHKEHTKWLRAWCYLS